MFTNWFRSPFTVTKNISYIISLYIFVLHSCSDPKCLFSSFLYVRVRKLQVSKETVLSPQLMPPLVEVGCLKQQSYSLSNGSNFLVNTGMRFLHLTGIFWCAVADARSCYLEVTFLVQNHVDVWDFSWLPCQLKEDKYMAGYLPRSNVERSNHCSRLIRTCKTVNCGSNRL